MCSLRVSKGSGDHALKSNFRLKILKEVWVSFKSCGSIFFVFVFFQHRMRYQQSFAAVSDQHVHLAISTVVVTSSRSAYETGGLGACSSGQRGIKPSQSSNFSYPIPVGAHCSNHSSRILRCDSHKSQLLRVSRVLNLKSGYTNDVRRRIWVASLDRHLGPTWNATQIGRLKSFD